MNLRRIAIIAGILVLLGAGLFAYRAFVLDFPLSPNRSVQSWHVEARLAFDGQNRPAQVQMFLPRTSERYTIVDENFVSNGFAMTTSNVAEDGNRIARWSKRHPASREIVYYRAILYEARAAAPQRPPQPTIPVPVFGSAEFAERAAEDAGYFALNALIKSLKEQSTDPQSLALALFGLLAGERDSRITQIRENAAYLETDAAIVVYVLNHAGIPARIMNGISLEENVRSVSPERWPEIYLDGDWLIYDAESATFRPRHKKLGWWVGPDRLYELDGGQAPVMSLSVRSHVESALTEAIWQGNPTREAVYKISVFNLPVDSQIVFAILLLVPVGALVVSFMRQIIGIHTYGTFMPVLVALAFRETQLFWGLILFTVIIGFGLVFRAWLDRLQLLLVPRLGAILTLVVISIYIVSMTTFNLGIHAGLSISLFPMVILAMLIERMSITWEEFGARTALQTALGSFITAIAGYAVISNETIGHLVSTFPELLLIVLAAHMLIGRYNGYKLTEYYRFRMLK